MKKALALVVMVVASSLTGCAEYSEHFNECYPNASTFHRYADYLPITFVGDNMVCNWKRAAAAQEVASRKVDQEPTLDKVDALDGFKGTGYDASTMPEAK